MLVVDDENGDPGAYPEYPRDSDTSDQEPLTLESSQVNNNSDSETDPQEIEQAS